MRLSKMAAAGVAGKPPEAAAAAPRWNLVPVLTLLLITAVAIALRFFFLERKPFWFDECFSVEVARLSWHDFARLMWWREANMSLYYLLLRGWLHFGSSPFFIRTFSVLASLAALPAVYQLSNKLFDRRVAMIAVALASCNAYSIRYAQEARSYSLLLLLATLSSFFFVCYVGRFPKAKPEGYVLASALAVYAHLYALLLIAAHWLSLRLKRKASSKPNHALSAEFRPVWIAIGLCVLPLLGFVAKTGAGPIRWIGHPSFRDVLDFLEHLAGNDGAGLLLLYLAAASAGFLPLRRRRFWSGSGLEVWRYQFLSMWLIFPVALTLLLSLARPLFLARYFIFCLPPLIILAAAGLANLRKGWMLAGCLAAMLLLSLQGTLSYYDHDFDLQRDGAGAATSFILDHSRPGDAILFHIAETRVPFEFFYALRDRNSTLSPPPEIIFPRHGDHLDYRDMTGKPTRELLQSIPAQHARLWVMLMNNLNSGNPDPTTVMLNQSLAGLFPHVERTQFANVEVRLYSRM